MNLVAWMFHPLFRRGAIFTTFVLAFTWTNIAFAENAAWIAGLVDIKVQDFFVTPAPNHQPFLDKISDPATTSLKLFMYHLTDPEVVQALLDRAKNGKGPTQIILNRNGMVTDSTLQIALTLQKAGIQVAASTKRFTLTHAKTMLVNGVISMITTINLTTNAPIQRDYGLTTDNVNVAKEVNSYFDADWELALKDGGENLVQVAADETIRQKAPHQPGIPPGLDASPASTMPNLIWSPVNSQDKIVDLINYAEPGTDLIASVENIRNFGVQQALLQAVERGVKVRLVVPQRDLNPDPNYNLVAVYEMQNQSVNGKKITVDVRLMPPPSSAETPYIHAKMIVVNGKKGKIAAIMSENFSFNSLTMARELGIIFLDKPSIVKIENAFNTDWIKTIPPGPQVRAPLTPGKIDAIAKCAHVLDKISELFQK